MQIIKFKKDHEDSLFAAEREVKQAIENGELNIKWMDKNYETVFNWMKGQNSRKRS